MFAEIARDSMAEEICKLLEKQLTQYTEAPDAQRALKEVGREVLHWLPSTPKWAWRFEELFKE